MSNKTLTVQVACGFDHAPKSKTDFDSLSPIDRQRGDKVVEIATSGHVAVTGMVPYTDEAPGRTLAELNAQRARVADVAVKYSICGLNAFSESRNVTHMAKIHGYTKIRVVSSDFYFAAYERMWRAAAKRADLDVEIISLDSIDIASDAVWKFYKGLPAQILSRVAASSQFGHWLAVKFADFVTRDRPQGWQKNGYTEI